MKEIRNPNKVSNDIKKFYSETKVFTSIVWVLFSIVFIPLCLHSLFAKDILYVLLYAFMEAFATFVAFLNLYLYGNVVTGVKFVDEMTIIETNVKTYQLPSKNFYEVVDSDSFGRVFIKYADDNFKKVFVFQKQYSLFKKYSLDIDLIRKNMPNAAFYKS